MWNLTGAAARECALLMYSKDMERLIIYTDGGARGNPGSAAVGVVIQDEAGKIVKELSEYIGETTNNQAEYEAVIRALRAAKKNFEERRRARGWGWGMD